jgi:hypothetical protein
VRCRRPRRRRLCRPARRPRSWCRRRRSRRRLPHRHRRRSNVSRRRPRLQERLCSRCGSGGPDRLRARCRPRRLRPRNRAFDRGRRGRSVRLDTPEPWPRRPRPPAGPRFASACTSRGPRPGRRRRHTSACRQSRRALPPRPRRCRGSNRPRSPRSGRRWGSRSPRCWLLPASYWCGVEARETQTPLVR